jgi:hypothetical protein
MQEVTTGPGEWLVRIAGWVIQDGNYEDFAIGQYRRFALEFHPETLEQVAVGVPSSTSIGGGWYEVTARVAYADGNVTLIDSGLLAYSSFRPPASPVGTLLHGIVLMQVDHYAYFEIFAKWERMLPAVYSWIVTGIWRETAPFVPDPRDNVLVRDPARRGLTPVERTNAWTDDSGHAEYVLRCRLEPEAPGFRT